MTENKKEVFRTSDTETRMKNESIQSPAIFPDSAADTYAKLKLDDQAVDIYAKLKLDDQNEIDPLNIIMLIAGAFCSLAMFLDV